MLNSIFSSNPGRCDESADMTESDSESVDKIDDNTTTGLAFHLNTSQVQGMPFHFIFCPIQVFCIVFTSHVHIISYM